MVLGAGDDFGHVFQVLGLQVDDGEGVVGLLQTPQVNAQVVGGDHVLLVVRHGQTVDQVRVQVREHLVQRRDPPALHGFKLRHPHFFGILLHRLLNVLVGHLPLLDGLVIGRQQVHIFALRPQPLNLVQLLLYISRLQIVKLPHMRLQFCQILVLPEFALMRNRFLEQNQAARAIAQ